MSMLKWLVGGLGVAGLGAAGLALNEARKTPFEKIKDGDTVSVDFSSLSPVTDSQLDAIAFQTVIRALVSTDTRIATVERCTVLSGMVTGSLSVAPAGSVAVRFTKNASISKIVRSGKVVFSQ